MKKTYINPEMVVTIVEAEQLIAESPFGSGQTELKGQAESGSVGMTKDNTQSYDVWDDDWSK